MPHRSPRPPRLTLRFAVYAGVALALAGAASVWFAAGRASAEAERAVLADARFLADRLGRDDLARSALGRPAAGDLRAQLDEVFDREALGPQATRVTIFRRDGRVTYSTDHRLIGTMIPRRDLIRAAVAGEPSHRLADLDGRRVIESYVPVHWVLADPSWAAGVLGVSRDYAPVQREIRSDVRIQAATILLALLLLYVSLFPILRRVTNDLKARNRSLADSEARWRALTAQASDGVLVLDGGARVLDANPRASELTGRPAEDLAGRGFAELVHPDDLERTPLRLDEVRAGEIVVQDRRLVRGDGSAVTCELSSRMLDDGRILVLVRDVTERKELEAERRRALRAEATERLAAGIAHDFDRLLEVISGSAAHDERIRDAVARGTELTAQLRAFGRRRQGQVEVVALDSMLAELEPSLRRLAGGGVALATDIRPDLGRVEADPEELRQLLADLVLNACDSLPAGGTVTLTAANVDFGPRAGDARVRPGRYVMIAVGDTGGVAPADEERVSLGLATVFALVHRTGGTIGVESEPGEGTTVRVYLPRVAAEVVRLPRPEPAAGLGGSETVLVAEDEHVVRAVVREMLEERGYVVLEAGSGSEALEVAASHDGPIHVLVTDVVMPGLGGFELGEEFARVRPETRAVYMSGYTDRPVPEGVVFLQKPFTHDSLARTLRDVLDRAA